MEWDARCRVTYFLTVLIQCYYRTLQTPLAHFVLKLSIALSTWSPRFTCLDLYQCCRSVASLAKRCFYLDHPKMNGSKSVSTLIASSWTNRNELWNYQHHYTPFSVLRCFRSMGYLLQQEKKRIKECIYYPLIQNRAGHKTRHVPSHPVFSSCVISELMTFPLAIVPEGI